jgi:hypothetical protein
MRSLPALTSLSSALRLKPRYRAASLTFKHIGSSDSLLAIPAYLFDDVLGPTVFVQLARDLLPFIIGELRARLWDDRLRHEIAVVSRHGTKAKAS